MRHSASARAGDRAERSTRRFDRSNAPPSLHNDALRRHRESWRERPRTGSGATARTIRRGRSRHDSSPFDAWRWAADAQRVRSRCWCEPTGSLDGPRDRRADTASPTSRTRRARPSNESIRGLAHVPRVRRRRDHHFQNSRGIAAVAKGCAAANGLRGVIQLFAARDSEVGQRRPRTVAQTASGAAPADADALSTVCLRR